MTAPSDKSHVPPASRRSEIALLLVSTAACFLLGCVSGKPDLTEAPLLTLAPDDPRLLELGLVYDDTIVTESGRTVDFNGQAIIPRYIYLEKSGANADLTVELAVTNLVLGLNKDFTVKLSVPYVTKRLDQAGAAPTLRAEGLGDAALTGKLRFYQETGIAKTTEASAILGFELPSGRDDVRAGGVLLPAPLQLGSGSLDTIFGGAITHVDGRWLVSGDVVAKLNSKANNYRFGNTLRADIGGQYRLVPSRYKQFDQLTVNLIAELNSVWLDGDQANGNRVSNSGGFKLFATPGIQVIFNRFFLLEAAVQLPLAINLHGTQLEEDFVAIIGLRARF